ncbi:MAG: hypothetical protein IJC46_02580 [Clostridia bacterium]|nr:hypothetical protein [Clostridia bacterium]
MRFRERVARFMIGRYGADSLGRALIWISLAFSVAGMFTFRWFSLISLLLLIWAFFRLFSRNYVKRQRENEVYLRLTAKPRNWLKLQKNKHRDRKTHAYKKCPHCKATLRLPKKKGKHTVCCPKCRKDFEVKI